jgi:hypothetical protein
MTMNRKLKTRKQVSDGESFQEFCPRHSNENVAHIPSYDFVEVLLA